MTIFGNLDGELRITESEEEIRIPFMRIQLPIQDFENKCGSGSKA